VFYRSKEAKLNVKFSPSCNSNDDHYFSFEKYEKETEKIKIRDCRH